MYTFSWKELILSHQKHIKKAVLSVNDSVLFNNSKINRKLSPEARILVLDNLVATKNASLVNKENNVYEIYWLTLEEWGNILFKWAQSNGMINSVLTVYELLHGNDAKDQEWHELEEQVFIKVLKLLESKNKCELIEMDGEYGVKFF